MPAPTPNLILSMGDVTHVILSPKPSHFSHVSLKSWEQPGYEAMCVCVCVMETERLDRTRIYLVSQDKLFTEKLVECLGSFDMFDTNEGQDHRLLVLGRLNELMKRWIIQVSNKKGKTDEEAREVGGKIFTFGSYRLGVHGKGTSVVIAD